MFFLSTVVKHFKTPCSLTLWKCWEDLSSEFCSSCKRRLFVGEGVRDALREVWSSPTQSTTTFPVTREEGQSPLQLRRWEGVSAEDRCVSAAGGSSSPAPRVGKCRSGTGPERWLCPALRRWGQLLQVVPCGPGDGSVTQEEVSSLFDVWDYTLSLLVC